MRMRVIVAAVLTLAAAPVFAQSADVHGPWSLNASYVMCTDVPVAAKPAARLVIKGPHAADGRSIVTTGLVVIGRTPDDGLAVGQRYVAQRLAGDQTAPRAGDGFHDLRITGFLTITALDELNALASVDFACDAVATGDWLEPYVAAALPTTATAPIVPDFSDRGSILFGLDNRVLFGHGDVLSIDRGTVHGIAPGQRFAIYRDRRDGMPLVHVGEAVVMTTGELTSKVVITTSFDGIESGDVVVPRRPAGQ
jgi:hypothetical protein